MPRRRAAGFTVIELLVVLAALAVLLSVAAPRYLAHVDQARDTALRHNLRAVREALDQFEADRGRSPAGLQELVDAKYLREWPVDPVTQRTDTWVLQPGLQGRGVGDVRSGAPGLARDGTAYATW